MKRQAYMCSCGKEFTQTERTNIQYNGNRCPNCRAYKEISEVDVYILPDGSETTEFFTTEVLKMEIKEVWDSGVEGKVKLILIAMALLIVVPIVIGLALCLLKLFLIILSLIFKFIFWALF